MKAEWHPERGELLAWLDVELDFLRRWRVARHVRRCWTCRADASEIEQAIRSVRRSLGPDAHSELEVNKARWRFREAVSQAETDIAISAAGHSRADDRRRPGRARDKRSRRLPANFRSRRCERVSRAGERGEGENMTAAFLGKKHPRRKDLYWDYGRDGTYPFPGKASDRSPNLAIAAAVEGPDQRRWLGAGVVRLIGVAVRARRPGASA